MGKIEENLRLTETPAAIVAPIEFTCTEKDVLDAFRLHETTTLRGRRFLVLAAAGTVGVAYLSMNWGKNAGIAGLAYGLAGAAIFLCLMAIIIVVSRLFALRRSARRQFSQQKELASPMKVAVHPPRIAWTTLNSFADTPTENFLKWAENDKSILLYRSDRLFHLIPKRVVSDDFQRSLAAELKRAGVPRAGFSNS